MPFILTRDCPKCNEPLVVRRRKKDNRKFVGCSNFPECKFACNYEPAIDEAGEGQQYARPRYTSDRSGIDWDHELKALIVMAHPDRVCNQHDITSHLNFLRDKMHGRA